MLILELAAKPSSGVLTVVALFLAGCAAPQYDDQTDKLITQLQTDVDTEIVSLITLDHKIDALTKQAAALAAKADAASQKTLASTQKALADAKTKAGYEANTSFYDKVDVDLTGLQTRVDAEPSPATPFLDDGIAQIHDNLLADNASLLSNHQQYDILSESFLRLSQKTIDQQIGALLTRELGLKGSSSTASSTAPAAAKAADAPAKPAAAK
jgi:hypothetical protein